MKKPFILRAGIAVTTAAVALIFSSCAYDPYYSSAGGSYSSSYGQGYGYGSNNFSTSLFVSTGDPRWGYDPSCYSYYDYNRRSYYDPYLNGYYPVGYRPQVVYGAPHPHGWSPGRSYCPPPRNVRTVTVSNYRNRESAYRSSDYSWANKVRVQPSSNDRSHGNNSSYRSRENAPSYSRDPRSGSSPSIYSPSSGSRSSSRESSYSGRERQIQPQPVSPSSRQRESSRLPSGYNTPVTRTPSRDFNAPQRSSGSRNQQPQPSSRQESRGGGNNSSPSIQRGGGERSPSPSIQRGGGGGERQPQSRDDNSRSIRGLGQG